MAKPEKTKTDKEKGLQEELALFPAPHEEDKQLKKKKKKKLSLEK